MITFPACWDSDVLCKAKIGKYYYFFFLTSLEFQLHCELIWPLHLSIQKDPATPQLKSQLSCIWTLTDLICRIDRNNRANLVVIHNRCTKFILKRAPKLSKSRHPPPPQKKKIATDAQPAIRIHEYWKWYCHKCNVSFQCYAALHMKTRESVCSVTSVT